MSISWILNKDIYLLSEMKWILFDGSLNGSFHLNSES